MSARKMGPSERGSGIFSLMLETCSRAPAGRAAVMIISIRSPSGMTDCTNDRTGPQPAGIQLAQASSNAGLLSWSRHHDLSLDDARAVQTRILQIGIDDAQGAQRLYANVLGAIG